MQVLRALSPQLPHITSPHLSPRSPAPWSVHEVIDELARFLTITSSLQHLFEVLNGMFLGVHLHAADIQSLAKLLRQLSGRQNVRAEIDVSFWRCDAFA